MEWMKMQQKNSITTIRKRAVSLILALVLIVLIVPTGAIAVAEPTYTFGDWQYQLHGPTVIITGYTGQGGTVTIPSAIEARHVLYIGNRVFQDYTNLTNVTIPDGVAGILENAFDMIRSGIVTSANSSAVTRADMAVYIYRYFNG